MQQHYRKVLGFLIPTILALLIWFAPIPVGVDPKAWHLLALFVWTIAAVIAKPLPMGAVTLMGLTLCGITKTLTMTQTLSGFSNAVVWLIVIAFFIARGFIKTGLGSRLAYSLMSVLGKSTLGMGYGITFTDLAMAPAIPSLTARAGGVMFPVLKSLCSAFGSLPDKDPRKMGSYLFQVAFQASCITSAMFLTAMAGNPLIADIAAKSGVNITWGSWALAAIVPGIVSLIFMPLILYWIYPPEMKVNPEAKVFSQKKLKELGKMSGHEWIMLFTFILLLALWIMGSHIGIGAGTAAMLGVSILMATGVLKWDDIIHESGAWNILIWFSVLIMMADNLSTLGLTTWFGDWIVANVHGFSWGWGFFLCSIVYFYAHYFFASNVAHIGALYAPFLILAIGLGTPPLFAALTLGFFSNLFGGLTHYGCGPAPIFFGSGYVKIGEWWRLGFVMSVINIVIWLGVGYFWWSFLGHI
ncbi:MAG: anion permease [Simkaniaceae bacterium]|nr:anion permease [Simkaniaceae bacterium]